MKRAVMFMGSIMLLQLCFGTTTKILLLDRSGTQDSFPNPDLPTTMLTTPAIQYINSLTRLSSTLLDSAIHDTVCWEFLDELSDGPATIDSNVIIIGLFGWPGSNSPGFSPDESRILRNFLESTRRMPGHQRALIFEGNDLARRYANTTSGCWDSLLVVYFNVVYMESRQAPAYLYGQGGTCFEGLWCVYSHNLAPGGPDTLCDDVDIYTSTPWTSHANWGFYGIGKDPARGIVRRTYSPGATILFSFSLANVQDSTVRDEVLERSINFSISPLGKITYPTTSQVVYVGDTVGVKYWHYDNFSVSSLKIKFSSNGGSSWSVLKSVTYPSDDDTTYEWVVPDSLSNDCYMMIELEDDAKNFYQDTIGPFSISSAAKTHDYASVSFNKKPFPNPFNSSIAIPVYNENTSVAIVDIRGNAIKTFPPVKMSNLLVWDGTDETGQTVSSGIYFVRLIDNNSTRLFKIIFIP